MNIPYGQFLHLKRNFTNTVDYQLHRNRLQEQFTKKGYPTGIIDMAVKRAELKPGNELFQNQEILRSKRLAWLLDYNTRTNDILRIVKKHWHIVSDLPGCQSFPFVGLRRTKALKNILVKAKVTGPEENFGASAIGHHKCAGCSVCHLAMEVRHIEFPDTGFVHYMRGFSNCNSQMCIYLLICVCQKRYIGSTRRKLKVHIQEHRVMEAPLVQNFVEMNHTDSDFKFLILETVEQKPGQHRQLDKELLKRETFWIFKLNTVIPHGLNVDIDYSVNL